MTASDTTYSGDVTLTGDEQPPVEVSDPENVYVLRNSIAGNLKVTNAEYVYTAIPAGDKAELQQTETTIGGSLEDSYVEPGGVEGDLLVKDAEDVFIEPGAVDGDLQIIGDEQRFHESLDSQPTPYEHYDDSIHGWDRSLSITDPDAGVAVVGSNNKVTISEARTDFELFVTGWNNEIRINGQHSTVRLHFVGAENAIETNPYTDVTIETEAGHANTVTKDSFPVEDLIQTSKSKAYNEAFIGRKKITYQSPAMDESHCPSCGATADAVIERHREDAFFLFGYPIYHFEAKGGVYACEECSRHAHPDVRLTEEERTALFQ